MYARLERRRAIQCCSTSIARHGGGSTPRVDILSPFFLELWGYSGWTCLLHQVKTSWILLTGLMYDLNPFRHSLQRVFTISISHQQRRSEEYNLVASSKWRGSNNRTQKNSRYVDLIRGEVSLKII